MKYKTKYSVIRYGCEIFTSYSELIAQAYAYSGNGLCSVVKHNKKEWK